MSRLPLGQPAPRALMEAACKGAEPRLFDAISGEHVLDALSYCDRCDVTQECEAYVRPRVSLFTGVCAGKVWHNGVQGEPGLFNTEGNP